MIDHTPAPSRPRPAPPAAIVQLMRARTFSAGEPRVVLVRAEPRWSGPELLTIDHGGIRTVRVAAAVSPLAVLELVTGHHESGADDDELLAVLTDADEAELGAGLLSRVYMQRVYPVEPWAVVRQLFGARDTDPRLRADGWAAEALIEAAGQSDWPKIPGGILTRDTALSRLAAARLSTSAHRLDADGLDLHALLAWSLAPGAAERLSSLREPERQGLTGWLTDQDRAGSPPRALSALFALFDAGHGADAVAMGLVCAALWSEAAPPSADRARGRAEQWFGAALDDETLTTFGLGTESYVRALLVGRTSAVDAPGQGPDPRAVLERAETLVRQFGAEEAAASSAVLQCGLDARYAAVARALVRCVPADAPGRPAEKRLSDLDKDVKRLEGHVLAGRDQHRDTQVRIRMAQRLVRWLRYGRPADFRTSAAAVDRHITDYAWADLALGHIHDGDNAHPALPGAFAALCAAVRLRRRALDEAFAARLAEDVATGGEPTEALLVETFSRRVLAPVVRSPRSGGQPLLFLLLDGASAAITADLAEQLRALSWVEYDPVVDVPGGDARRRAMTSALPSLTTVSRGSLFAGELVDIGQDEERDRFTGHRFWKGAAVSLFHKAGLRGGAGTPLGTELTDALADPETHVAVVVNTIDDRLREDRPVSNWQLDELLGMRELLAAARVNGRALVITSDHGHVIDRGSAKVSVTDALSARHRAGQDGAGPGEIELSGRRVVTADHRIVALWDTELRYANRQAGYHGGVALAEVAIPVLAFVPGGATAPKGWRELGPQRPPWWSLAEDGRPLTAAGPEAAEATPVPARRPTAAALRRQTEQAEAEAASGQEALVPRAAVAQALPSSSFAPGSARASRADLLLQELESSDIMKAQLEALPRPEDFTGVGAAVRALVDAHGILPLSAVAEHAGKRAARAAGFAATLQRVLNYDQAEVLTLVDSGRSLRLDLELLRQQFGLPAAPGAGK